MRRQTTTLSWMGADWSRRAWQPHPPLAGIAALSKLPRGPLGPFFFAHTHARRVALRWRVFGGNHGDRSNQ